MPPELADGCGDVLRLSEGPVSCGKEGERGSFQ